MFPQSEAWNIRQTLHVQVSKAKKIQHTGTRSTVERALQKNASNQKLMSFFLPPLAKIFYEKNS